MLGLTPNTSKITPPIRTDNTRTHKTINSITKVIIEIRTDDRIADLVIKTKIRRIRIIRQITIPTTIGNRETIPRRRNRDRLVDEKTAGHTN